MPKIYFIIEKMLKIPQVPSSGLVRGSESDRQYTTNTSGANPNIIPDCFGEGQRQKQSVIIHTRTHAHTHTHTHTHTHEHEC